MRSVDVNTIILMTGLLSLLLAWVLLAQRKSYPGSIRGLRQWAVGIGLCFLATLLFATRGWAPDAVSMLGAYAAAYLGAYLFHRGSQRFLLQPTRDGPWLLAMGLALAVVAILALVEQDYRRYRIFTASFMGFIFLMHAILLLRHGEPSFANRFTIAVLLVQVTVSLTSSGALALGLDRAGPLDFAELRTVYVASLSGTIVCLSIGVILLATERLKRELQQLASHDALTGALTRRALTEACEQELERFRRHGHAMSLLMVDLDHFKAVNDTHGHIVGDKVLETFAARVKTLLRRADQIGRFGGEEFVILLPETSVQEAAAVAERVRLAAQQATAGLPVCTVSIGVGVSRTEDESLDALLKRADDALYEAKNTGRNRVVTSA